MGNGEMGKVEMGNGEVDGHLFSVRQIDIENATLLGELRSALYRAYAYTMTVHVMRVL